MGGDHAPGEIVRGALDAAQLLHGRLLLVGDPDLIVMHLPARRPANLEIVAASEAVGMHEKPLEAYRTKKDSSLRIGANLVKDGLAQAFVSAGNTGAAAATCQLTWRTMPGIHRPAIASAIPNRDGQFLLLDAGASPDVDPEDMLDFALMGRAYAQRVLGKPNPGVHLLNIGEEEGKGNQFAKEAYQHLSGHSWFRGNIESKDMFAKPCDVVVCEAFVGNAVLKTAEGVAELMISLLSERLPKSRLARLPYFPLKSLIKPFQERLDWGAVGGSPLLGLNGLCIIAHGRSHARAIKNAVLLAQRAIEANLVEAIRDSVQEEMAQHHA